MERVYRFFNGWHELSSVEKVTVATTLNRCTPPKKAQRESNSALYAINIGISSTIAGILTEIVFYGLDSYKVMQQAGKSAKFAQLFRGALPIAIAGSGPSTGVFFILYNPLRNSLNDRLGPGAEGASVLAASILAGLPSSLLDVPADVVKKHVLLGNIDNPTSKLMSIWETTKHLVRTEGVGRLFLGWRVNLYKDTAFTALEMSLYEAVARAYLTFSPAHQAKNGSITNNVNKVLDADCLNSIEAAGVGSVAGVSTAVVTCPIDCVNTRIKSGELARFSVMSAHVEIVRLDGVRALFRGVAARAVLHGVGATVFWYLKASITQILNGEQQ